MANAAHSPEPSWSERRDLRLAKERARRDEKDRQGRLPRSPDMLPGAVMMERIENAGLGDLAIMARILAAVRDALAQGHLGAPDKPLQAWDDWEIIDYVKRQRGF